MREMKDSGVEWIGKIPKDWNISAIKYLCPINSISIGPFGSSLSNKTFANEKYNVYGQANLVSGDFSKTKNTVSKKTFLSLKNYEVLPNDICVSMMGTIGKCRIVPNGINQGIMDSHLIKLKVNEKIILPKFFVYVYDKDLGGICFLQMQAEKSGAIMAGLNTTIVKRLIMPIPSLNEQKFLIHYLDKKCAEIDALTADIQTQIDKLEQYKRSVITEAVTKGLDKNAEMKDSGIAWCPQIPKHWTVSNPKALFMLRNERARKDDQQLTSSQKYGIISQEKFMQLENQRVVTVAKNFSILKHVEPNDFVISMRSFQGGLEYSEVSGCISSAYVMLIPNEKLVFPPFYRWFFKSSKYINALQSTTNLVRDGQALRYANFVMVPLFIIPLDEQKQIAEYLDKRVKQIDEIHREKQKQLELLASYKKSLIYEYVTGKKEVPAHE